MNEVKQTRPAQVRAWLATQQGRKSLADIAAATGIPRRKCAVTMGDMRRLGHVDTEGEAGAYLYGLTGKEVREYGLTAEQRMARQREIRTRYRRSKGVRPRAEVDAERRDKSAERKAKREAEIAARPKPSRKIRAPRAPRASATRPASQQPRVHLVAPSKGSINAAAPKKPAMTSDDFIRQGGTVERIPAAWERQAA